MRFDEGIFGIYSRMYENRREVEYSLEDYLRACSDDPSFYAGAAERLLKAIGEPIMVDTSQDPRLGRIFMNRTIKVYPAFEDFYGMEETIERIVGFFRYRSEEHTSELQSHVNLVCRLLLEKKKKIDKKPTDVKKKKKKTKQKY